MYKLSMYQVVCVVSTCYLPLLFWIYPRYAAYYGGVDGQWAVLGACVFGLFSAWLHGLLNTYFPKWTGAEMPPIVFGKTIGKAITLMFLPGYLLFLSVSLYSFSITIKSLLPNTPRLATTSALALIAAVGALYGIETIARVSSITFPVVMLVLSSSFILVFFRGSWTGVFLHPVSMTQSVSAAAILLPMFFGLNMYLMLSPYYDHRKRNAIWLPMLSVILGSSYVISVYIITIRVVGYEGLRVLSHPIDFVLQLVQLHGLVIQRFGVGLIFIATMFQAVFYATHLWGTAELSRRVLNLKKSSEKWFIWAYFVIILIIFTFISDQEIGDWLVMKILVPLSWIYLIVEPSIKLLCIYLQGKDRVLKRASKFPTLEP